MRVRYILSGAAANLYGQAVTIGTQLLSVPVLIGIWGLHDFGLWTMLVTIPALLLAMDFGYSAAAAGMMSKAIAWGDREDALTSLHTALAVVLSICLAMITVAVGFGTYAADHAFGASAGMTAADVTALARTAPYLLAYVAIMLPAGLINAVYRVNDHYPLGVLIYETARLIEQLLVMGVVVLKGDLADAAIALIVSRTLFTIFTTVVMLRVTPWVTLSFSHFAMERLKAMFRPAMAAMFIPLCVIVGVQGVTLMVGVFLSPAAAGAFATLRTLFRMVVQVVGTLTRASVPEFALIYARDDAAAKLKIARFTAALLFGGAALGAAGVLLFGPAIVAIWTHGKVAVPYTVYLVLVTHAFFGCIWNGLSNLITGLNLHSRYVPQLLVWNVLGVSVLFFTIPAFGLVGAAASIAFIDTMSFLSVLQTWNRAVPGRWWVFERKGLAGRESTG